MADHMGGQRMTAAVTPDRAAWLEARRRGIGGSDAAAVVGLHPWVSPLALYYDKRAEFDLPEQEPTEAMEWGLRLEPVVADAWQEKVGDPQGLTVVRYEPYSDRARREHPEIPWMHASPDGFVCRFDPDAGAPKAREMGGWEAKTANGWAEHDWDDDVPPHVQIQCQHQMAVTGHPRTYGAVLLGGQRFVPWVVERDDETIAALIDAEREFWQRVTEGRPPRADSKPSTGQALKARWTETLDEAVELGEEGLELVTGWRQADREQKRWGVEKDGFANRLRQLLGENEVGLVFGEIAVTWRPTKAGSRRLAVKEIV
jgi:putative phage-type endonuclease